MSAIPYARQSISEADIEAVVEVLRSDWLTQGPGIARFEQVVAAYCGARNAVAVSNGTAALHLACLALELGPGELLWTSANTFAASANCARYCGADVDFVDIDPQTYNLSIPALEAKLAQAQRAGRLPKILVPVHFGGQPCDMQAIGALAARYGFRVVEDASHAVGAECGSARIGACTHSDIAVFSFHPVKILTTGRRHAAHERRGARPQAAAPAHPRHHARRKRDVRSKRGPLVLRAGRTRLQLPDDRFPGCAGRKPDAPPGGLSRAPARAGAAL
jgi:dTDP-4-amino-4,6-dideoxygalactose transaminase